jgi:YggT family protein
MGLVIGIVAALLLLFQFILIIRAILDWTMSLGGRPTPGSVRARATEASHLLTEPVLAPVRKVVPPLRLGTVALDLAFIVVFVSVLLLREFLLIL